MIRKPATEKTSKYQPQNGFKKKSDCTPHLAPPVHHWSSSHLHCCESRTALIQQTGSKNERPPPLRFNSFSAAARTIAAWSVCCNAKRCSLAIRQNGNSPDRPSPTSRQPACPFEFLLSVAGRGHRWGRNKSTTVWTMCWTMQVSFVVGRSDRPLHARHFVTGLRLHHALAATRTPFTFCACEAPHVMCSLSTRQLFSDSIFRRRSARRSTRWHQRTSRARRTLDLCRCSLVLSCSMWRRLGCDAAGAAGYQRRAAPPLRAPRGNHP